MCVSVLFSEPKIPQSFQSFFSMPLVSCFSALQRAENSSISHLQYFWAFPILFQCSSASRKFLNVFAVVARNRSQLVSVLFSEPKIPQFCKTRRLSVSSNKFQCSSASRKFLNRFHKYRTNHTLYGFSALQRAENSSIKYDSLVSGGVTEFQCSSASRKFLNPITMRVFRPIVIVSVLFSEPKIPQLSYSYAK